MRRIAILGVLVLLAMVVAPAVSATPDLVASNIYPQYVFADLTNVFSVNVTNQGGTNTTVNCNVSLTITGMSAPLTGTVTAPLSAGSSRVVDVGSWKPTPLENLTMTAFADCDGEVGEGTNEDNNNLTVYRNTTGNCTVDDMLPDTCYGYRGDNPLSTVYEGTGKVIYSVGDFKYKNNTVNFDIGASGDENQVDGSTADIPGGATIKNATLYVYYCYRYPVTGPNPGADPRPDFEMSINGGSTLPTDEYYTFIKGFTTSETQYGTLVYDVTSNVTENGTYQAVRSNCNNTDPILKKKGIVSGMALMIIYEDASGTYRIAHGYDRLATYYKTQYKVLPEDATTTATLTDVDPNLITSANLLTVTVDAVAPGSESQQFNSCPWEVGAWNCSAGVPSCGWNYPLGINRGDVTSCITASGSDEVVQFQERLSNGFAATNAILTMEKKKASVGTSTGSGTATFDSDAGAIEDLTAIAESAMPGGGPNLLFPHGFFAFNITGLDNGATANVTITLPENVPRGTQYWKYNGSEWIQIPMGSDDGDNVITIQLTDGGIGDTDGAANGVIVDPGSVGVKNVVYFAPQVSEVPGGADSFVEVRVNSTDTMDHILTGITFDPSRINITDVTFGPGYTMTGWSHLGDHITIDAFDDSGCVQWTDRLVANLTIHCEDCCASSLSFTGIENTTRLIECAGVNKYPAAWMNGSVICGTPIEVAKTVWNPDTLTWVDEMDVQDLNTSVMFNYTVHATCCNLTDLIVTDQMDDGLKYSSGSATVEPDMVKNNGRTLVWNTLSDLDVGNTLTIKFNATTEAYGVPCNVVTVTGLCDGIPISADDDVRINMGMPKIAVEPIETIVQPQEQFDINITVDPSGACEVYAVEYDLHYDPTVLRAESLVKGPFLGEISETMVTYTNIDEVNGIVTYAETRKVDGGVIAKDVVTRIHFTAIGARGANTTLNLTTVIIADNATKLAFVPVDIINGTVEINNNVPPVPIPQLKHRTNNVAQKYQSTAVLCSCSYDPDGVITYLRWAFGDGQYGTSEGLHSNNCTCKEHDYESHQWEPYGVSTGHYVPFNATLTVTDSGSPEESNSTFMNVTVYIAGDANGDGKVNVLDAVWVGKHWRETCCTSPPCDPCGNCEGYLWDDYQVDGADLNNDCKINVLDAVIIGANWRHVAW